MPRSSYALAALATLAISGLDVRQVAASDANAEGFDSALIVDAEQRRWIVRAPRTSSAGAALEAETTFLAAIAPWVASGDLPFAVPDIAGSAPLPEGGRAVVHAEAPGQSLRVDRLAPGPGLAASLGRGIAAVHELPVSIVEHSGHPVYSAEEYRERRQTEVDDAALTGRVPATLLRRWENRLNDVALWRFRPTITHANLSAESLLVRAGSLSAVQDWSEVQVADPADDLAWLLAAAPTDCLDTIMEAYQLRRTELLDPHLMDRAILAGELALVRWLLYGVHHELPDVVEDAVSMLSDLDIATAAADGDIIEMPTYGYRGPRPADDVRTTHLATQVSSLKPEPADHGIPAVGTDSPGEHDEDADRHDSRSDGDTASPDAGGDEASGPSEDPGAEAPGAEVADDEGDAEANEESTSSSS